jgi:hypothetical protein
VITIAGIAILVAADAEAVGILGQPITTGIPGGNIEVRGPEGVANLSFSAKGPNGSGTVYVKATRSLGQWQLQDAVLEDSNGGRRIDLVD